MDLTRIEINLPQKQEDRLKAYVSIELDGCFLVTGIRIVQGDKRLHVQMPNRRAKSGEHVDIAFPICKEFRCKLEEEVLAKYALSCTQNRDD